MVCCRIRCFQESFIAKQKVSRMQEKFPNDYSESDNIHFLWFVPLRVGSVEDDY